MIASPIYCVNHKSVFLEFGAVMEGFKWVAIRTVAVLHRHTQTGVAVHIKTPLYREYEALHRGWHSAGCSLLTARFNDHSFLL